MEYLQKLRSLLDKKTKVRLLWLVAFSIFLSTIEVIGISAIMPFIDITTNFENIHSNQYYQWIFSFFNFENNVNFAIVFGLVLFGFFIFRGIVNLAYSYTIANFTENLYVQTTKKLFAAYLAMPYQVFTRKNSSYLTKTIVTEATFMSSVLHRVLVMLSEIFVVIFLYVLMLIVSWKITFFFTLVLLIKMIFLVKKISSRIKTVGATREKMQAGFYEVINRTFGNFEHIKLQDSSRAQQTYDNFSEKVERYADANAKNTFLQDFPRLFIETGGFSLIIFLLIALVYLNQSDVAYILPTLSLFVLSLYRLLPSVNRIVTGYNALMYYHKSIDIVKQGMDIEQENLQDKVIEFKHKIELLNIDFTYQKKPVLKGVSLTINKGDKVAFVGKSGSGKSTLANLIIGLYQRNQGDIRIDNVLLDESNLQNWRSQIGYIPQQVYLFDGTIKDNICFGREFDANLLEKVLKQANIFDFLQTKQGIETLVGEGGVQLSGGQRQRVSIARALYGQPEILVLDEATSALDEQTESKIMDEIYRISQDKTLIIIAHRLSTIKSCDKIYKIKDGVLYDEACK
ncbi:Phospholipid-lipopolysaccharide ABC transporter [uncultured Candidatus Thioglobus sp.]|nr:Phospholipid-lipopolysaccharide ABC transporter [uncultured Candidatus Thioglobus sp.]